MQRFAVSLFGLMLMLAACAFAKIPSQCMTDQIDVQKSQLILHTEVSHKPHLVLLHNTSKNELIINHVVLHTGANVGWSSYLRPKMWSALIVVQPKFSLICRKINSDTLVSVSCGAVLSACYYANFKDENQEATGTYWVSENVSLNVLMQNIYARKIYLNEQL